MNFHPQRRTLISSVVGKINDLDEPLEETAGGLACVSNSLTPIKLFPGPSAAGWIILAGNQVWNIADLFGQNFYGGNATLIARVEQTEFTRNFRIHGLNAAQSAVRGQLASLRHHRIAWRESRFQEFRDNPIHVVNKKWVPRSDTAPGSGYANDLATLRDAILQNNQYPPLWGQ